MNDPDEPELALKACEDMLEQMTINGQAVPKWFVDYRSSLQSLVNGEIMQMPDIPDAVIAWINGRVIH